MEEKHYIQCKPKRRRFNPVHKWNEAEEKALVEFLMEHRNFEKPTAQLFYGRFIEKEELAIQWKLVRSKVRNMRTNYNKAKAWKWSTGSGSMEDDTIRNTLRKMFFYFEEFDDIFGDRLDSFAEVEHSMVTVIKSDYTDMESNHDVQCKPTRRRFNPVHKWNIAEEKALVEFLMEHRNFEKPTAQHFYGRFIEKEELAIHWKLVRAKVRNMRTSYNKAKAWKWSTGPGSMKDDTKRNTLRKMFFYFEEFDDIFGDRLDSFAVEEDSMVTEIESDSYTDCQSPLGEESVVEMGSVVEEENPLLNKKMPTCSRKGIYSKTALSEILEVHSEVAKIRKQKIEMEAMSREREMSLKEKKLELMAKEIELKEKEISNWLEIEKMKLQMQERIAMEELRLKYK